MTALYTPWGEHPDKTCPLPEYPRPQLRRDSYLCLNGLGLHRGGRRRVFPPPQRKDIGALLAGEPAVRL
jgi:hypothetical protein